jgi:hypothetical protein
MQTYINVYERDRIESAVSLDGIREDSFNYELRYKNYEGWFEGHYAVIDWETQGGDESMLPKFYDEVVRYLKFMNFTGMCDIHIYDRYNTFNVVKQLYI